MLAQLKQFVPSKICLSCDGCCRFQLSDSDWRPKVSGQEGIEDVDGGGFIKTLKHGDMCRCSYFNPNDNSCGIYLKRPFECALYPFILSKNSGGLKVYMHLACPYIQEKEISPELGEYVSYLKSFFAEQSVKNDLRKNAAFFHDYSAYEAELRFVFDCEV